MERKTKIYAEVKFPAKVIRASSRAFIECIDEKYRDKIGYTSMNVSFGDEEWSLDNFDVFLSEYEKDIKSARFTMSYSDDGKFCEISLLYLGKTRTEIGIKLPTRELIEKVFETFENYYETAIVEIEREKLIAIETGKNITYSLEKKLPSLYIDKQLISDLENFINRRVSELYPDYDEDRWIRHDTTIEDKTGTLRLNSISDYIYPRFPDDIQELSIYYRSFDFQINISFSVSSEAKLHISNTGASSREVVNGIMTEVMTIVNNFRTNNYLFHPSVAITMILALINIFLFFIFLTYFSNKLYYESVITVGIILFISFYFLGGKLKKYCTFETRYNKNLQMWVDWFVFGFLGFILFGVIGGIILQKLGIKNIP